MLGKWYDSKFFKNKSHASDKSKRQKLDRNVLDLKFNNDTLNNRSNDKILGVFVDNNLAWTDHTKHLTKKIASNI